MSPEVYRRVRELFEEALARPDGERAAFLDDACRDDSSVRQEVQRLLAAGRKASEILQFPGAVLESSAPGARPEMAGRRIGAYELLRELGHGGMGTVYLARRADEAFRKEVALKLVRPGLSSAEVVRRFQQEREIVASLDHPHIARLLDGGSTPEGAPFFVMEYVQGVPIDVYCDERRLDISARLKLFESVCAAVQYAHQNLVVHRDLKPSNILVTADGAVKLLDFGIAKVLGQREKETELLTHSDGRVMTPEYASPEQINGESITTASDVYSLGVVLYELLTGRSPYNVSRRVMHEILRAICEQEPARPSTVIEPNDSASLREGSATRLERRLRGDLDNIVLKALRKSAMQRYGSAEQFREDIERHLAGLPVVAQKGTLRYRTRKFLRRNMAAVAAGSVLFVALAGGIAGVSVEARRARGGEAEARRYAAEAARQKVRAEQQQELAEAGRLEASKQRAIADERSREAQARQGEAELRTREATAQRETAERRFNEVRQLATSLFDIHDAVEPLPGSVGPRNLIVSKALEYLDRLAKETAGNTDLAREVAIGYERLADIQSGGTGSAKSRYARSSLGKPTDAAENYRKALQVREALIRAEPGNRRLRWEWINLAQKVVSVKILTGEPDFPAERRKLIARLSDWAAQDPTDQHVENMLIGQAFNGCIPRMSQVREPASDDEMADCRAAVKTLDEAAVRHPLTFDASVWRARTWNQLAMKLISRKDYDGAREWFERAKRILQEAASKWPERRVDEELATVLNGLANAWALKGDAQQAMQANTKAIEVVRAAIAFHRQRGISDPLPSSLVSLVGPLVLCCGEDNARILLNEYRAYAEATESLLKSTPPGLEKSNALIALHSGLSGLATRLTRRPEAGEYAEQALRIAQELVALDSKDGSALQRLFDAHVTLGVARLNRQDHARSQESYRQALAISDELIRLDPRNSFIRKNAAATQQMLARSLAATGDTRAAEVEFVKGIKALKALASEDPSDRVVALKLAESLSESADLHRLAASRAGMATAEGVGELRQARGLYGEALERFEKSENLVRAYGPYASLNVRIKENLRQCELALAGTPR